MKFIENLLSQTPDTAANKGTRAVLTAAMTQWTGTFSDLTLLTRAGVAMLRGKANPIEETAMAKICNPGKTKHLTKEQRGFLAFQSILDRASNFIKAADPKGLAASEKFVIDHAIPRDALIDAATYEAMKGQTALVNAYDKLQHARTIFLLLKDKYGDAMTHIGTKTLEGKERKVSKSKDIEMASQIREMFKSDPVRLGEESTKYIMDPANYVLPKVETEFDKARAKYAKALERGLVSQEEYDRNIMEIGLREGADAMTHTDEGQVVLQAAAAQA